MLPVRGAAEALAEEVDEGLLLLANCRALRRLPDGLRVRRALNLAGCAALESLPRDLRVGEGHRLHWDARRRRWLCPLDLTDCAALRALPEDLALQGAIEVAGCGLTGLPQALSGALLRWRGLEVTARGAFQPESLTVREVLGTWNTELRRFLLERAGLERILAEAQPRILDEDRDAGGPRRLLEIEGRRYLECRCPSTGRLYLLQVPPQVERCHAAAAALAGFADPARYRPLLET